MVNGNLQNLIYIRELSEEEVLHCSLESVESAEEWIISILRAMKGKSLNEPISLKWSAIEDSILCLLAEFDGSDSTCRRSPLKTPSLVDNCDTELRVR